MYRFTGVPYPRVRKYTRRQAKRLSTIVSFVSPVQQTPRATYNSSGIVSNTADSASVVSETQLIRHQCCLYQQCLRHLSFMFLFEYRIPVKENPWPKVSCYCPFKPRQSGIRSVYPFRIIETLPPTIFPVFCNTKL
jgi:hypothetical protein